jgi:cold-inducible RNA-binding protein
LKLHAFEIAFTLPVRMSRSLYHLPPQRITLSTMRPHNLQEDTMAKRLYIGNLSYEATERQLRDLFSQAGEIASVDLITDKFTGRGKGFAFVEMATDEGTQEAINRFDGYSLDDRAIVVNEARPREERSSGGGGGGRKRY